MIYSFMLDYFKYVSAGNAVSQAWTLSDKTNLFADIGHYIPQTFNWWVFSAGEVVIIFGIASFVRRALKQNT